MSSASTMALIIGTTAVIAAWSAALASVYLFRKRDLLRAHRVSRAAERVSLAAPIVAAVAAWALAPSRDNDATAYERGFWWDAAIRRPAEVGLLTFALVLVPLLAAYLVRAKTTKGLQQADNDKRRRPTGRSG